jgi:hypothetical protein
MKSLKLKKDSYLGGWEGCKDVSYGVTFKPLGSGGAGATFDLTFFDNSKVIAFDD